MKRPFVYRWMLILSTIILSTVNANFAVAQKAAIVKFPALENVMSVQNDTTYIFNFFATWCVPCVEEFPNFQKYSQENADKKIKVVFVSLDFKKDYRKRLLPFLKARQVKNSVMLLDETDYNSWIDKIDSAWDGDIPATLIVNNSTHRREIYHRELSYSELETAIKPFLQ